jgi:predicted amidohydrolase YtcJ
VPITFALLLAAASSLPAPAVSAPNTIYLHGRILTGDGLENGTPVMVEALAIRNGYVLATGTDAQISALGGPGTEVIDLHGAFAMPGLNDAHVHLGEAGRLSQSVDLTGVKSLAEMEARIHKAADAAAPAAWLNGGGWDQTLWPRKTPPTRQDLDAVTGGHPAIFSRVDEHIAVANTKALEAAGITRGTPDPVGGRIDRDAQGEATGIVREAPARALIEAHIPPPSAADRRRGLVLALADAADHGLTSVQDNSYWEDFEVLQQLEHEGKLPVRVSEWLPFDAPVEELRRMRGAQPADDLTLRTTMLKGFMDGSLGSHTAAMLAPYADQPGNSGLPRYDQDKLNAMAAERAAAGFQIGFHAIGDRAVDMALTAFAVAEAARTRAGVQGEARFRIEHSQVLAPGDVARYKQLGVIASMQPSHLLSDMRWAPARLGPAREMYAYNWKAFLDAGVPLALGTDYPVEPITPFRGLYSAVTRQDEAGSMSFHPEDKLTIAQAIYAYTQGSAYAEFTEGWKGRLAPGYVADMVVLDHNLLEASPRELLKVQVLYTMVGGRISYQSAQR